MKFKRQSQAEDSINLTPLIDVVFLLLIFFMVSTTFTKETHLSVDLPEAVGEASIDAPRQLDILITAQGDYSINGQALMNNSMATLKRAISDLSGGDTKVPLSITADAQTPHQAVITAMDAAGQLGFVHLSMTTRNPKTDQ